MDFTLDKKHEMARQLFRDFAEKEVKPLAIEVDETEEFPRVTVDKMIKAGFMGIPVPKEYGGQLFLICAKTSSKNRWFFISLKRPTCPTVRQLPNSSFCRICARIWSL